MTPHDCLGWTLDDARAALETAWPAAQVCVRETAPPLRPNAKAPTNAETFGAWRVLRCGWREGEVGRSLEVVAARERVLQVLAAVAVAD